MDYYRFLDEFDAYNDWNRIEHRDKINDEWMSDSPFYKSTMIKGSESDDIIWLGQKRQDKEEKKSERVNSPSHYTSGKREVIDIIEDAVKDAPSSIYGMLQAQVLKYMLRVWLKDNPLEDLKKARWYLERLISHYENPPGDNFPPGRWDRSLDDFKD